MRVLPGPLLWNLLLFVRVLRGAGIPVAANVGSDLVAALDGIDPGRRDDVRNVLRCVLIHRHADLALFDRAFDAFWRSGRPDPVVVNPFPEGMELDGPESEEGDRTGKGDGVARGEAWALGERADGAPGHRVGPLSIYSPDEVLRTKDFALLSPEELAHARRFLAEVDWGVGERRSLRLRPSPRGRPDTRRALRAGMRHGGELLELPRRGPKAKRRPLVLLCDISGSMDRYTRLLLHFLHSVERGRRQAEVFVFATRLTRITRALQRDPDDALAAVAEEVKDWSGGTRIGDALRTFNREWARRVLHRGAVVLIISDGWDRGDPDVLAAEMRRLQRGSYRTVWLNPLLGSPGYRPLTQGMRAALPFVDDFLPVHNLQSLAQLAVVLQRAGGRRPLRGQRPGDI